MSFLAMCSRLQNFISRWQKENRRAEMADHFFFFFYFENSADRLATIRFHGQRDLAFPMSVLVAPIHWMIASHSGPIAALFHQCPMYDQKT